MLVKIKTFDSVVEANISKARLEDAGILCILKDENLIQMNPLFANLAGGVKLFVTTRDEALARILLNTAETRYKENLICPACGSTEVHFVTSEKDRKNIFSILLSAFTFTFPIYLKKKYVCDRCKYEADMNEFE